MSRFTNPDLTRLALLAQTRTGDLKPLLLKVHAMAFAADDHRDAAAVETFETLALGLIPLVDAETADQVRAILDGVADVPPGIVAMLIAQARLPAPASLPDEPATPFVADETLTAARVRVLVESARRRPSLAREMLARPDLTPYERALLYRHADEAARDALREDLAIRIALRSDGRTTLSGPERGLLVVVAEAAGFAAATAQIAKHLALPTPPDWKPQRPMDAEFFALSLLALGLQREDCIRVFLTVDPAISLSVRTVFRLNNVVRATGPAVASYLVAADLGLADAAAPQDVPEVGRGRDPLTRDYLPVARRSGALDPARPTQPRAPDPAGYGHPGYRSRSTISRDRS